MDIRAIRKAFVNDNGQYIRAMIMRAAWASYRAAVVHHPDITFAAQLRAVWYHARQAKMFADMQAQRNQPTIAERIASLRTKLEDLKYLPIGISYVREADKLRAEIRALGGLTA